MLATPTHSTLPSGHATQAHAVAMVLSRLIDGATAAEAVGNHRFRIAARIAINRTVAGVHFPVDSASGAALGIALGEWIAAMGGEPGEILVRTFKSGEYVADIGDFHDEILADLYDRGALKGDGATAVPQKDTLIEALWAAARAEWR
jgi:hypothetical protein